MTENRKLLLLGVILLFYLLLAVGYGLTNPLFEAPDAQHHFFTARHIAETGTLPTTDSAGELARQEAAQPPLYYLLAAPLVALVDTTGAEGQLWSNPTVLIGEPRPINVNSFVHTAQEAWPWHGYALAAHLVRFLSTIIGAGTLISIYGSGRLIWPTAPGVALLATALVAFLPQYAFLHGAINNDVLIIFLCSLALWQLTWLWVNEVMTGRLILLGLTIGLAILSKMTGLLLLPLSVLVFALKAWRERQNPARSKAANVWVDSLRSTLLVVLPALLVSGWLLWRNWTNYGDPTAANQFIALAGGVRPYTLQQVWHDMDRVVRSAVAFFGWMNVLAPRWLYLIWAAILFASGCGWLFAAWRRNRSTAENRLAQQSDRLLFLWMGAWVLLVSAAWLRFMMQTPADQGRLLFPALLPAALFVARGIASWQQRWPSYLAAGAALFTSIYALLVIIPAAYDTADLIASEEIPPEAGRFALDMGYGIELVAVQPAAGAIQPGEWAWVDLYWRASETPQEAPFERAGLYGRDHALVGSQENYHGGGNYPANQWAANQIVRDRIGVQLLPEAELPAQLRLLLRIHDDYEPVEIARVKAIPQTWPEPAEGVLATFGGGIDMTAVSIAQTQVDGAPAVTIDVQWVVNETPGKELTTFVHLGDPTQAPLAQGDGPALGGDYPTGLWAAGEVIDDGYELILPPDLPAGSYPLHIGFYDPTSGERLNVGVNGQPQPDNAYLLDIIDIE